MKKFLKVMCIVCTLCMLFTTTVYAEESTGENDIFVAMSFGSDEKEYITVNSNGVCENDLPTVMPGHFASGSENSLVAPAAIFGSDGREKVTNYSSLPYTAICFIITTWPNGGTTAGTGWMFNEDSMMTAAHCVYNSEYGGAAIGMKVYPAKNGINTPYGEIRATNFVINSHWEESLLGDVSAEYDYALVKLETPIGNECGYFGYTYNGGSIGNTITVTGYPGDKAENENGVVVESLLYQWTMSGRLNTVTTRQLSYLIDTNHGQSGAPVYLTNSNIAIGIHHGSAVVANTAARITENIYQLMIEF